MNSRIKVSFTDSWLAQASCSGAASANTDGDCRHRSFPGRSKQAGFTLLEVMIAVAFVGIAMLALLSLHHSGLQEAARARELTQAAMLAQALMADAEQARFPEPGQLSGDFQRMYPGQYLKFRWQRVVAPSDEFPDIRRVRVTVFYGPRFHRTFVLTEFMHNPIPQLPSPGGTPGQQDTP